MKMLTHDEVEALRTAPAEGDARAQAALRLLDAYERLRGEHHDAGDLECLLDEAIANQSLYHGDDPEQGEHTLWFTIQLGDGGLGSGVAQDARSIRAQIEAELVAAGMRLQGSGMGLSAMDISVYTRTPEESAATGQAIVAKYGLAASVEVIDPEQA